MDTRIFGVVCDTFSTFSFTRPCDMQISTFVNQRLITSTHWIEFLYRFTQMKAIFEEFW